MQQTIGRFIQRILNALGQWSYSGDGVALQQQSAMRAIEKPHQQAAR